MEPFWSAPGGEARLYLGDVRAALRAMPSQSVQCCITSPPYWGLRDYGTGTWVGGSAECDHSYYRGGNGEMSMKPVSSTGTQKYQYKGQCPKCGAMRTDAQLGSEDSPDCLGWATGARCGECFVCHMVDVFAEVRRVLRDDGTCWLNLGDSYNSRTQLNHGKGGVMEHSTLAPKDGWAGHKRYVDGMKDGDLCGVPWRVALALQADGWMLRNDNIWNKPNPMPESCNNRCTKSHEYIFLLAKGEGYFYDKTAIEDEAVDGTRKNKSSKKYIVNGTAPSGNQGTGTPFGSTDGKKNKRDVWTVPVVSYPGAHFATFSPELITPCILAGTSEHGACAQCRAPYKRVVVRTGYVKRTQGGDHFGRGVPPAGWDNNGQHKTGQHRDYPGNAVRETMGWKSTCGCGGNEVVPCVVLDPFVGSGTTVATSLLLGRHGVGIDLSEIYLRENAIPRIEAAMRGERVTRKPTVVVQPFRPLAPKRVL